MVTIHLRKCWPHLVIRGKQFKTTLRLHLSAEGIALINKTVDKCWWRCEGRATIIHCLISIGRQYGQFFHSIASLSLSSVALLTTLPRTCGSVFCPIKWPEFELSFGIIEKFSPVSWLLSRSCIFPCHASPD